MEGLYSEHVVEKVIHRGDIDNQETARVSMKDVHKLAIAVSVASVNEALPLTLRQHDAASGGNSKDLLISNPYFHKLDSADEATKVDAPDTASVTESALTNAAGKIVLEVLAEDLDVENGYAYVSVVAGDLTSAREAVVDAKSHMPRFKPAYEVVL